MSDLFCNTQDSKVYYSPHSDRLFIFHHSTFFQLPGLEREDGKFVITSPEDLNYYCKLPKSHRHKLYLIGEL